MAYLKPINPMWNSYRSAYWLCEVRRNGIIEISYPVYPRNKMYSGVYSGIRTKYNPVLMFGYHDTINLYSLLGYVVENMKVHENYNAPYVYYDLDWLAKMLILAMLIAKCIHI